MRLSNLWLLASYKPTPHQRSFYYFMLSHLLKQVVVLLPEQILRHDPPAARHALVQHVD